jgi:prepilin-type processing-associated H-X9-DG protein
VGPSWHFAGDQSNAAPVGVFRYRGQPIGIRDVLDGTANTIAFSEWKTGDFNVNRLSWQDVINVGNVWIDGGSSNNTVNANAPLIAPYLASYLAACRNRAGLGSTAGNAPNNRSWIGEQWATGMMGRSLGNTLLPPNVQMYNCESCEGCGDFDGAGIYGMSSYHAGGVNTLMADGSVRFLKDSTALNVVWALGSRNGSETISSDQY